MLCIGTSPIDTYYFHIRVTGNNILCIKCEDPKKKQNAGNCNKMLRNDKKF